MSNVVVVYHSGYGHTRVMAEAVALGVERHLGSTCQLVPVEEVDDHWDRLHSADAIIFGAPTYMGSASAHFKAFLELLQQQARSRLGGVHGRSSAAQVAELAQGVEQGDLAAGNFQRAKAAWQQRIGFRARRHIEFGIPG